MGRLADLILHEIGKKGCSVTYFAESCGLSRNEVSRIINRGKEDVNVSTVLKICENSDISIADVFGITFSEKEIDEALSKFVLTDGERKYRVKKY